MTKLNVFKKYIENNFKKKFIISFSSSTNVFIFFVSKSDEELRLCVNYKKLNAITKKNRYFFSFINSFLNRLVGAKKYTKFDIRSTYNALRIKKKMNEKQRFDVFTIIMNIKSCFLNCLTFLRIS